MHIFVSARGSLCGISVGNLLYTNCARTRRFQPIGVSFEPRPPLRGGYMTQKLSQSSRWLRGGVARLESEVQRGLAAKADFSHWSVPARL
jgi:hypothetical protein